MTIDHQVQHSRAMAEAQISMGQGLNALPNGQGQAGQQSVMQEHASRQGGVCLDHYGRGLNPDMAEAQSVMRNGVDTRYMNARRTAPETDMAGGLDRSLLGACGMVNVQRPATSGLQAGDLAYVRGRIARMAAFVEEDARAAVVLDRELVLLLHRWLSGGAA